MRQLKQLRKIRSTLSKLVASLSTVERVRLSHTLPEGSDNLDCIDSALIEVESALQNIEGAIRLIESVPTP